LQAIHDLAEFLDVTGHGLSQQLLQVRAVVDEWLHEGDDDIACKLGLQWLEQ
jgi:hypothetical protein